VTARQTGGAKRTWLLDPSEYESVGQVREKLIHHDTYFEEEEDGASTLSIVLDRILADLDPMLAEPVRLVYLEGQSYRAASRVLGIDHKTVKARANRGLAEMRSRLTETAWVASMLKGFLPDDDDVVDLSPDVAPANAVADVLKTLMGGAA
jgi:DNA-directed RNA polymerase specialized sigma24 family protein